jgi:hypothetical protein
MSRIILTILALLTLPACSAQGAAPDSPEIVASSADETAERQIIFDKLKAAIASSDFAALSAMADDFRKSKALTPSGLWKLGVFHAGVQAYLNDGLRKEDGCQYRKAKFVRDWAAASPRSPAPAITDAALLVDQAWCFRGSSYANKVPPEAWPKFNRAMALAALTLDQAEAMASIDPEFFAVKVIVLRGQGPDKGELERTLEEATNQEPYYHRTYFNAAVSYLPQWGGSHAELESFARYVAHKTSDRENGGFYARIFWYLNECNFCGLKNEDVFDWPTLKQSMRDVYALYPVRWNGEYFAGLSCRMQDSEEGHRYFRAIHPEATGDGDLAALFSACDADARAAN